MRKTLFAIMMAVFLIFSLMPGLALADDEVVEAESGCSLCCTKGKIIIVKETIPESDKCFQLKGTGVSSIWWWPTFIKDGMPVVRLRCAGTYDVEEIVPDGWELISIDIDETGDDNSSANVGEKKATINLEESETVTVTFTNVDMQQLDYGDAPDDYGTTWDQSGASHAIVEIGPRLGSNLDADPDGQPSSGADGDDGDGDDEDGIVFTSLPLEVGATESIQVTVNGGDSNDYRYLDAWIDFNINGSFDPSEHLWGGVSQMLGMGSLSILEDLTLADIYNLTFDIPEGAIVGDTYARFRLSSQGNLGPTGFAADGEVEDYMVSPLPEVSTIFMLGLGMLGLGGYVWLRRRKTVAIVRNS